MMENFLNLDSKKILITGAGRGIGRSTAILLSQLGAKLYLTDINKEYLNETLNSLYSDNEHRSSQFDLSSLNEIERLIEVVISEFGPLDGFVHCVGIRSRRPINMIQPIHLIEVLNVNLGSFVEIVRCIARKNNFNPGLSIVAISSIAAHRGSGGVTAYAASKAALESAVRCLAKELAPKKIRLNTVVPGQINTPEYARLMDINESKDDPVLKRQYLGLGEPHQVATSIAFLLSSASSLITGASLPLDGGYLSS